MQLSRLDRDYRIIPLVLSPERLQRNRENFNYSNVCSVLTQGPCVKVTSCRVIDIDANSGPGVKVIDIFLWKWVNVVRIRV